MFNRFAAGRKVYGQGSYAPTKGQLNPQGYIQREIRKRNQQANGNNGTGVSQVGNDGQSDTRSGLAANAMKRNGMSWPNHYGPQAVAIGPRNNNNGGRNGNKQSSGNGSNHSSNPGAVTSNPSAPVTPTVNISPAGQLQLPYNSEFANQALDAQMAFDAEMLDLQQSEQEQALAYQQQMRDLDYGYQDQQRSTLNDAAARGNLYSSAYGVGVNEDARQYNNMKNDLGAKNSLFHSGAMGQRNAASAMLQALLQRATQGYADSLAEDAGGLGFGVDAPAVPGAPKAPKAPSKAKAPVKAPAKFIGPNGQQAVAIGPKPPQTVINNPHGPRRPGKK